MTREEAARILDPSTTREALAEIECNGHEAVMKAVEDACMMGAEALRQDVPDINVGQWIPCSERLPEEANYYEVTVSYDGLVFTSYSFYSMAESCWCTYQNHITAWRERLPEPYKGVE